MEPLSKFNPPLPRLVELESLRRLAQRCKQNPGGTAKETSDLAEVAGSPGEVRPKANVVGDNHFWIAKFTSADDSKR